MSSPVLVFSIAAVAIGALLLLVGRVAKARLNSLSKARELREKFFEAATSLVRDERLPRQAAAVVLIMSRGAGHWILPYVLTLTWGEEEEEEDDNPAHPLLEQYHGSTEDDLRKTIAEFVAYGLLLISYQSVLVGPRLRRQITGGGGANPTSSLQERDERYLRHAVEWGSRHYHHQSA